MIFYTLFPFTLTYGGIVDRTSGSTVGQGAYGYFWSVGANSTSLARTLNFYGSYVYQEGNDYKSLGFSVRCGIFYTLFPFTLTYGGYIDRTSGSTVSHGTLGFSWSIGADSATLARYLGFGGSVVNLELDEYKSRGFPVRCVSK